MERRVLARKLVAQVCLGALDQRLARVEARLRLDGRGLATAEDGGAVERHAQHKRGAASGDGVECVGHTVVRRTRLGHLKLGARQPRHAHAAGVIIDIAQLDLGAGHKLAHLSFLESQVRELAEGYRDREDLGALVQHGRGARGGEARVDVDPQGVLDLLVLAQRNDHHRPSAHDVGAGVLDVEHLARQFHRGRAVLVVLCAGTGHEGLDRVGLARVVGKRVALWDLQRRVERRAVGGGVGGHLVHDLGRDNLGVGEKIVEFVALGSLLLLSFGIRGGLCRGALGGSFG